MRRESSTRITDSCYLGTYIYVELSSEAESSTRITDSCYLGTYIYVELSSDAGEQYPDN